MSNNIKNDLINWKAEQLSDDSPVYNSKDLINALNSIMPSLGSVILTTNNHVLSKQEDWDSITMNTLNMFTTLANSGLPASDFPNNSGIILVLGYTSYNIYIAISGEAVYYRLGDADWNKLLTSETIKDLTGSVATLTNNLSKLSDQQTTLSSLFNTFKDSTNKQLDTLNTQSTSQAKMLEDINNQLVKLKGTHSIDNASLTTVPAFQSLQTQVNNSAVGTNLLMNTGDFNNWTLGQPVVAEVTVDTSRTPAVLHYPMKTITSSSMNIAVRQLNDGLLQPSTTYTISFYAKGTGTINLFCIPNVAAESYSDTRTSITLTNEYKLYTRTFTTIRNISGDKTLLLNQVYSSSDTNQNTVEAYIYGFKLEKGSVATDWCPNPSETWTGALSDFRMPGASLATKINGEFTDRGVNVKWFGAVGDGKTDDTDAIQKAIDYVAQNGGGKVIFGPHPYIVNQLNIDSPGISLIGARTTSPIAGTRLISKPGATGGALLNISHEGKNGQYDMQVSGLIRDLSVLGCLSRELLGNSVARIGVRILNYAEYQLTNVLITNFANGGLVAKDWWDSTVTGLEIRASGTKNTAPALYIGSDDDSTNSIHFFGLHIEECPYAMKIDGLSSNNQFVASKFEAGVSDDQASQNMIDIYEGVYATLFDSCFFSENVNGTWLNVHNNQTTITNSSFDGPKGIVIKNESIMAGYGCYLRMTNNIFHDIGNDSDFIQMGPGSVFTGNYIDLHSGASGNIVFGANSTVRNNSFLFSGTNTHIKFNGPLTRLDGNNYVKMPENPFTGNTDVDVNDRYYETYTATNHININFNDTLVRHNLIWTGGSDNPQTLDLTDLKNPFSHEVVNIAAKSDGLTIAGNVQFASKGDYKVNPGDILTMIWLPTMNTWIVKKTA